MREKKEGLKEIEEVTWDAEKDFLDKYLSLMEQVKKGGKVAYYQIKELRAKEFRGRIHII